MINPYYYPEKLNLELHSLDEPGLSYEYNTLCFWSTGDGRVFSAQDSGCSCPTPFEGYSGETQKDVLQSLEQIGSPEQAEREIRAWSTRSRGCFLAQADIQEAVDWVKEKLSTTHYSI